MGEILPRSIAGDHGGISHGKNEAPLKAVIRSVTTSDATSIQMIEFLETRPNRLNDEAEEDAGSKYKSAILWSFFISISSLMWGYDILLTHGLASIPGFQHDFGVLLNGEYIISGKWQIIFNTTPYIGGLIGSLLSGYASNRYGPKNLLAMSCIISIGAIVIQAFSEDAGTFTFGRLIYGGCTGIFLASTYASEIIPSNLSHIKTFSNQLLFGIGQFLASITLKVFGSGTFPIAYEIPLTIQLIFPFILLCGMKFCPESPVYLLKRGEVQRCEVILKRLGYSDIDAAIGDIQSAIEAEIDGDGRRKGYLDCFRGVERRKTEIVIGAIFVSVSMAPIIAYCSYFFEIGFFDYRSSSLSNSSNSTSTVDEMGFSNSSSNLITASSDAFSLSMVVTALALIGIITSWFTLKNSRIGRRMLMLSGTILLAILMLILGILDVVGISIYGQSVCIIIFAFVYFFTISNVSWIMFTEIPSPSLRSRTCVLSVVVLQLLGIVMNILIPLLINPQDPPNLAGKIGFLFFVIATLSSIWIYFRIPETSNRTPSELSELFQRKIPARKFKDFRFDAFPTV